MVLLMAAACLFAVTSTASYIAKRKVSSTTKLCNKTIDELSPQVDENVKAVNKMLDTFEEYAAKVKGLVELLKTNLGEYLPLVERFNDSLEKFTSVISSFTEGITLLEVGFLSALIYSVAVVQNECLGIIGVDKFLSSAPLISLAILYIRENEAFKATLISALGILSVHLCIWFIKCVGLLLSYVQSFLQLSVYRLAISLPIVLVAVGTIHFRTKFSLNTVYSCVQWLKDRMRKITNSVISGNKPKSNENKKPRNWVQSNIDKWKKK